MAKEAVGKCSGERIYSGGLFLADLRRVWQRAGYDDLAQSDPASGTRTRWVVRFAIGARWSASTRYVFRRHGVTRAPQRARAPAHKRGATTRAGGSSIAITTAPSSAASCASTIACASSR